VEATNCETTPVLTGDDDITLEDGHFMVEVKLGKYK
jgi:hypothetical protein